MTPAKNVTPRGDHSENAGNETITGMQCAEARNAGTAIQRNTWRMNNE